MSFIPLKIEHTLCICFSARLWILGIQRLKLSNVAPQQNYLSLDAPFSIQVSAQCKGNIYIYISLHFCQTARQFPLHLQKMLTIFFYQRVQQIFCQRVYIFINISCRTFINISYTVITLVNP